MATGSLVQAQETELMKVYALQEELLTTSDMRSRSSKDIVAELHHQLLLTLVITEELVSREDMV